MQLRRKEGTIAKIAAAQKEKQQIEAEKKWRKEHPDQYLESLGLVKEKNAWEIEAALKLNEMKDPLAKLISEYKKKSTGLKNKGRKIKQLKSKLLNDMQKLPGAFKNEEFREWVLNGRRRFGNESNRTRRMLDEWTRQYDYFRERVAPLAVRLDGKIDALESAKNHLRNDLKELEQVTDDISSIDRRADILLDTLDQKKNQIDKEKIYVQSAIQSTGLEINGPDITNTENLLKKANEILDEDLFEKIAN